MANYVEGIFRARGKKEDMLNFVKNQLMTANGKQAKIIKNKFKDGDIYFSFFEEDDDIFEWNIYIQGIRTGYLTFSDMPCLYKLENKEFLLIEEFRRAWDLNLQELEELAKKYVIDIKVNVYERGLQFSKLYEINRYGYTVLLEEKKYVDYNWDCPMPLLGG